MIVPLSLEVVALISAGLMLVGCDINSLIMTDWVLKKCFLSIILLLIWLYRVAIGLCVCVLLLNILNFEGVYFPLISKDVDIPYASERAV